MQTKNNTTTGHWVQEADGVAIEKSALCFR